MASKDEIVAFLASAFPQSAFVVEEVGERRAVLSLPIAEQHLRPGGTVSGPTMMSLVDVALYVAIFGEIGIVPLAVTTSLTINFLRRPAPDRDIVGICRLLKVGKALAVGEVSIYSRGDSEPVAHAVGTYSIPRAH